MDAAHESLRARSAAEICAVCELETDVAAWLREEPDADAFLTRLQSAGAHRDAVTFLCHALQPREAVWLAWDIACQVTKADADAATQALAATSTWLVDTSDANRRAAHAAAEGCGFGVPAGCAALSAFLAEGSLGPADLEQAVPPPPGACAKAAVGALLLAAVAEPEHADTRAQQYVARWFELAATEPPWIATDDGPEGIEPGGYNTDLKF